MAVRRGGRRLERGLARELREGGGVDAVYEHLVLVRLPLAAAEAQEVAVVQV